MPKGGALLSLLTPYEPEDLVPRKKKPKRPKPPRPLISPSTHVSPDTKVSPSKSPPLALPPVSPDSHVSPSTGVTPKTDKGAGDSRIKHQFFDDHLAGLPGLVQAMYANLNRFRRGTSPLTVVLTWKLLAERLDVCEQTARRAFKRLRREGLVFKEQEVYGHGGAQGIIFRVITQDSPSTGVSPSTSVTQKSKALEKTIENASPEDEAEYEAARAALEGKG